MARLLLSATMRRRTVNPNFRLSSISVTPSDKMREEHVVDGRVGPGGASLLRLEHVAAGRSIGVPAPWASVAPLSFNQRRQLAAHIAALPRAEQYVILAFLARHECPSLPSGLSRDRDAAPPGGAVVQPSDLDGARPSVLRFLRCYVDSIQLRSAARAQLPTDLLSLGKGCVVCKGCLSSEHPVPCASPHCTVAVHATCFGLDVDADVAEPWLCWKCAPVVVAPGADADADAARVCALCRTSDAAEWKQTTSGAFVHAICALVIPDAVSAVSVAVMRVLAAQPRFFLFF
jgi:hypothetical protein